MTDKVPKYMNLVSWVKDQIERKELKKGDRLYSENELSEMFQMSRQTVRHAIAVLEQENIVERRQGSGTYISDAFARKKEAAMNVAVVTTYVDNYIFPSIIKEIEREMSKSGYMIQTAFTHNRVEKESSVLRNLLDKNKVDGIIVEPTKSGIPNPNKALYDEIMERGIPAIFINSYYPDVAIPHVALDDIDAGLIAVNYLIEAGHCKIAGLFKSDDIQGHLRYRGYIQGLLDAGIKICDEHVLWFDTEDFNHIADEKDRVLKRLKGCTACVCYNDQLSLEIVAICNAHGMKVPEQMSMVSIDDSDLAALCEIPLTSVVLPRELLGQTAARNLLHIMEDRSFDGTEELKPTITVRKSVKICDKTAVIC